jgi:hypothetical protein
MSQKIIWDKLDGSQNMIKHLFEIKLLNQVPNY